MTKRRPPLPPSELIDRLDLIQDRIEDAHRELDGLMERHYLGGMPGSCCGRTRALLKCSLEAIELAKTLAAEQGVANR